MKELWQEIIEIVKLGIGVSFKYPEKNWKTSRARASHVPSDLPRTLYGSEEHKQRQTYCPQRSGSNPASSYGVTRKKQNVM